MTYACAVACWIVAMAFAWLAWDMLWPEPVIRLREPYHTLLGMSLATVAGLLLLAGVLLVTH